MTTLAPPLATTASPLTRALPYLAMLGSMLSFCVGAGFAKSLFPPVGAAGAIAYRTGFSALILLAAFRPWRAPLSRADLLAIMRYGSVLGLMNITFYLALRTIPLGVGIAIEFLGPLTVSVLNSRRPAHFAILALAVAGLVMLLPLRGVHHALDPVGVGFALCAALCWGLYIVFGKRTAHLPGGQAVAFGMVTAAAITVPIGVYTAGSALLVPALAATGLLIAVLSSAVPYSLEMVALKRIPAYRYGVMVSADPAIAAVVGWLMLAERLTLVQVSAIGLIVVASIGSVVAKDDAAEPDTPGPMLDKSCQ